MAEGLNFDVNLENFLGLLLNLFNLSVFRYCVYSCVFVIALRGAGCMFKISSTMKLALRHKHDTASRLALGLRCLVSLAPMDFRNHAMQ